MYILILAMYMGSFSKNDSNSLAVAEFTSREKCIAAGVGVQSLEAGNKNIKFICVEK